MFGVGSNDFNVSVKFLADVREFIGNIERSAKSIERFGERARKIGMSMTKYVTLPILGIGAALIKSGMDSQEARNLIEVTFKDMTKAADEWAKTTSAGLVMTTRELETNAAELFLQAQAMGQTRDKAFEMATAYTQLEADIASFRNMKFDEVHEAMTSGISGQTEALRRLGIFVSEQILKERALALGYEVTSGTLGTAAKSAAIYSLILEQTTEAQGDLIRTKDSVTNTLRSFQKDFRQLADDLGQALLPYLTAILPKLKEFVYQIKSLGDAFRNMPADKQEQFIKVLIALAAAGPGLMILGGMIRALREIWTIFIWIGKLNPWIKFIASFATLSAVIIKYWEPIKAWFNYDVLIPIKERWGPVKDYLTKLNKDTTFQIINNWVDTIVWFNKVNDNITAAVVSPWNKIKDMLVGHSIIPDMLDTMEMLWTAGLDRILDIQGRRLRRLREQWKDFLSELYELKYPGVLEFMRETGVAADVAKHYVGLGITPEQFISDITRAGPKAWSPQRAENEEEQFEFQRILNVAQDIVTRVGLPWNVALYYAGIGITAEDLGADIPEPAAKSATIKAWDTFIDNFESSLGDGLRSLANSITSGDIGQSIANVFRNLGSQIGGALESFYRQEWGGGAEGLSGAESFGAGAIGTVIKMAFDLISNELSRQRVREPGTDEYNPLFAYITNWGQFYQFGYSLPSSFVYSGRSSGFNVDPHGRGVDGLRDERRTGMHYEH
jgi:hypothetical protein